MVAIKITNDNALHQRRKNNPVATELAIRRAAADPRKQAPPTGLEPVTWRLTAARSTIELQGIEKDKHIDQSGDGK